MVLENHPIADKLDSLVDDYFKLLMLVMALPLVDGVFIAIILSGMLTTVTGMIEVGIIIFSGSATIAIIFSHSNISKKHQTKIILVIGLIIIPIAGIQALLAEPLSSIINIEIFERFAALVIIAIAVKTASSRIYNYIPRPSVIILLGFIASINLNGFNPSFVIDTELFIRACITAGIGVIFALLTALVAEQVTPYINLERLRFGSAIALVFLTLPILGIVNTEIPIALIILFISIILSIEQREIQEENKQEEKEEDLQDTETTEREPWL